ncbi:MAG: hypothetical protein HZB55_01360 [Deltaproteobacteria bacterium]|nr:hypothetical protein [Deltaproteobacteria bacterium]
MRCVHVFQLPPGVLGGLYAASFYDEEGILHRCMTPYSDPALLEWTLRPLRDALTTVAAPVVEGRVELGRHTGGVLHYFLPSAEPGDRSTEAREKRAAAQQAWQRATQGAPLGPAVLRRVEADGSGVVLCASAGEHHFLIRLTGDGRDPLGDFLSRAGEGGPAIGTLRADEPLCRDVMGEWLDG